MIHCYWCNAEIKPPYIVFSEEYTLVLCKKCKKQSFFDIPKEKMTEKQKQFLIEKEEIMKWIEFLKNKKWYCHNCGREIFGTRLFYHNKTRTKNLILKERCKRCGIKNGNVVDYKPFKKWFKSSGKSKRSNKNCILVVK